MKKFVGSWPGYLVITITLNIVMSLVANISKETAGGMIIPIGLHILIVAASYTVVLFLMRAFGSIFLGRLIILFGFVWMADSLINFFQIYTNASEIYKLNKRHLSLTDTKYALAVIVFVQLYGTLIYISKSENAFKILRQKGIIV